MTLRMACLLAAEASLTPEDAFRGAVREALRHDCCFYACQGPPEIGMITTMIMLIMMVMIHDHHDDDDDDGHDDSHNKHSIV